MSSSKLSSFTLITFCLPFRIPSSRAALAQLDHAATLPPAGGSRTSLLEVALAYSPAAVVPTLKKMQLTTSHESVAGLIIARPMLCLALQLPKTSQGSTCRLSASRTMSFENPSTSHYAHENAGTLHPHRSRVFY